MHAERLRAVTAVSHADLPVAPYNLPLIEALESEPPDLVAARAALNTLDRALAAPAPPPPGPDAQRLIHDILARPEFQEQAGTLQDLFAGPLVFLRRLFLDGLASVGNLLLGQERAGLYVAGGLAAGLVAAGLWFVWRSLRGRILAEVGQTGLGQREATMRSREWWLEGQRLAELGHARQAARAFFLSAALHLDELGLLSFDPSLTNREHLGRLARPDLQPLLEPLVASYDPLWYGHAACGPEEVASIQRLAFQVRSVSA